MPAVPSLCDSVFQSSGSAHPWHGLLLDIAVALTGISENRALEQLSEECTLLQEPISKPSNGGEHPSLLLAAAAGASVLESSQMGRTMSGLIPFYPVIARSLSAFRSPRRSESSQWSGLLLHESGIVSAEPE